MAVPLWSPPPSGWRHLRSSHPSAASRKYLPGGRRRDRYGLGMDSANYRTHLRGALDVVEACLAAALSARVEHCADWTLYDLAAHLGRENLWAAAAVTENRGDYEASPAPRDQAALARWFGDTAGVLLAALDTDPSAGAWTIAPPPTVGFWQRRRCLETLIHRWDAEHALGAAGGLDPALAADGVAEVIDTMAPPQVPLLPLPPPPPPAPPLAP